MEHQLNGMLAPRVEGDCVQDTVTVRDGDPVTFTVDVSGIPAPTVRWMLGSREIKQSKDFRLKDNGSQYSLIVSRMTDEIGEKGVTVVARNRMGETSTKLDISIYKVLSHRRFPVRHNSQILRTPDSRLHRRRNKIRAPRASMASLDSFSSVSNEHLGQSYRDSTPDDEVFFNSRSATLPSPSKRKPARPFTFHEGSLHEKTRSLTTSQLLGALYSPKSEAEQEYVFHQSSSPSPPPRAASVDIYGDSHGAYRPKSLNNSIDGLGESSAGYEMRCRSDTNGSTSYTHPDQFHSLPIRHSRHTFSNNKTHYSSPVFSGRGRASPGVTPVHGTSSGYNSALHSPNDSGLGHMNQSPPPRRGQVMSVDSGVGPSSPITSYYATANRTSSDEEDGTNLRRSQTTPDQHIAIYQLNWSPRSKQRNKHKIDNEMEILITARIHDTNREQGKRDNYEFTHRKAMNAISPTKHRERYKQDHPVTDGASTNGGMEKRDTDVAANGASRHPLNEQSGMKHRDTNHVSITSEPLAHADLQGYISSGESSSIYAPTTMNNSSHDEPLSSLYSSKSTLRSSMFTPKGRNAYVEPLKRMCKRDSGIVDDVLSFRSCVCKDLQTWVSNAPTITLDDAHSDFAELEFGDISVNVTTTPTGETHDPAYTLRSKKSYDTKKKIPITKIKTNEKYTQEVHSNSGKVFRDNTVRSFSSTKHEDHKAPKFGSKKETFSDTVTETHVSVVQPGVTEVVETQIPLAALKELSRSQQDMILRGLTYSAEAQQLATNFETLIPGENGVLTPSEFDNNVVGKNGSRLSDSEHASDLGFGESSSGQHDTSFESCNSQVFPNFNEAISDPQTALSDCYNYNAAKDAMTERVESVIYESKSRFYVPPEHDLYEETAPSYQNKIAAYSGLTNLLDETFTDDELSHLVVTDADISITMETEVVDEGSINHDTDQNIFLASHLSQLAIPPDNDLDDQEMEDYIASVIDKVYQEVKAQFALSDDIDVENYVKGVIHQAYNSLQSELSQHQASPISSPAPDSSVTSPLDPPISSPAPDSSVTSPLDPPISSPAPDSSVTSPLDSDDQYLTSASHQDSGSILIMEASDSVVDTLPAEAYPTCESNASSDPEDESESVLSEIEEQKECVEVQSAGTDDQESCIPIQLPCVKTEPLNQESRAEKANNCHDNFGEKETPTDKEENVSDINDNNIEDIDQDDVVLCKYMDDMQIDDDNSVDVVRETVRTGSIKEVALDATAPNTTLEHSPEVIEMNEKVNNNSVNHCENFNIITNSEQGTTLIRSSPETIQEVNGVDNNTENGDSSFTNKTSQKSILLETDVLLTMDLIGDDSDDDSSDHMKIPSGYSSARSDMNEKEVAEYVASVLSKAYEIVYQNSLDRNDNEPDQLDDTDSDKSNEVTVKADQPPSLEQDAGQMPVHLSDKSEAQNKIETDTLDEDKSDTAVLIQSVDTKPMVADNIQKEDETFTGWVQETMPLFDIPANSTPSQYVQHVSQPLSSSNPEDLSNGSDTHSVGDNEKDPQCTVDVANDESFQDKQDTNKSDRKQQLNKQSENKVCHGPLRKESLDLPSVSVLKRGRLTDESSIDGVSDTDGTDSTGVEADIESSVEDARNKFGKYDAKDALNKTRGNEDDESQTSNKPNIVPSSTKDSVNQAKDVNHESDKNKDKSELNEQDASNKDVVVAEEKSKEKSETKNDATDNTKAVDKTTEANAPSPKPEAAAAAAATTPKTARPATPDKVLVVSNIDSFFKELFRNSGSILLLILAVVMMQLMNYWISPANTTQD